MGPTQLNGKLCTRVRPKGVIAIAAKDHQTDLLPCRDDLIIGLKIDGPRTPRQGMPVLAGDTEIGAVTSGCVSPTLGHPIAMALVDREHAQPGTVMRIDGGRHQLEAEVVPLPFYKAPKKS